MTCENEASPSISSASPGASGSTDTAEIVGEDADRSTTTTLALRAIRRASVSAVSVMLSLGAVPRIVTLRAASPAPRKCFGELLDLVEFGWAQLPESRLRVAEPAAGCGIRVAQR